MLPVILALLLLAAPASAAPRGYFVDWGEVRSAPPTPREEKTGDYTCSVQRSAPDSTAARLLAVAESAYPPRAVIAQIALANGYELGSDTARVTLWWSHGTGPRRIPYAVSRDALAHYLKLTQKYRDHDYKEPGAQRIWSSDLTYQATIARRGEFSIEDQTFNDVYVASLGLTWTFDDGTFLPFVTTRRTVVLSARGDILAIEGDGEAVEDLSFSTHRGMGRQTDLLH
jgi:hypothetical protein